MRAVRPKTFQLFEVDVESDLDLRVPVTRPTGGASLAVLRSTAPPRDARCLEQAPVYVSRATDERGDPVSILYDARDWKIWRFEDLADFYIRSDRVVVHGPTPAEASRLEVRLLGPVMALWLEAQGCLALHASVVMVGEAAVAFLSSHGGGKTALAAAFLDAGHALVTDDVLVLEPGEEAVVRSSYPAMRMWPQLADHFLGGHEHLLRVVPLVEKRWVRIGSDGFGAFRPGLARLDAVYIPELGSALSRRTEISPVPPAHAVAELVRSSFLAPVTHALGWSARRLTALSRLAEHVPMRRLSFPSGFELLPAVREAILDDLDRARAV